MQLMKISWSYSLLDAQDAFVQGVHHKSAFVKEYSWYKNLVFFFIFGDNLSYFWLI